MANFISNGEGSIDNARIGSYFITASDWATHLSSNGMMLSDVVDISPQVAHFLHDPCFREFHQANSGLVGDTFDSWHGLGLALERGLASYVLIDAELVGPREGLYDTNLSLLHALVPYEAIESPAMRREWLGLLESTPLTSPAIEAFCRPHAFTILGAGFLVPCGVATALSARHMTATGSDLIREVPFARWSVQHQPEVAPDISARHKYAGLVSGVEGFDNSAFRIARAEAMAMDPQQRLLFEQGYTAIHASQLRRMALLESLTGVFVGLSFHAFEDALQSLPVGATVYAATSSSHSVASGRLAYVLDTHGQCFTVDTACSAALAACNAASSALRHDRCMRALSGAVNLMLSPVVGVRFALASMTSLRGRCNTLDARADGYARAEACCSILLAPPNCNGVALKGSAVRQDGRSASLTAPNGQAQQLLLTAALHDASTPTGELSLSEAHGTGTALGDPIEAGSFVAAVLADRESPLPVVALKANIGHAEPAAGMTGLLKLAIELRSVATAPNGQLRLLNPHVDILFGLLGALPVQLFLTMADSGTASGGVSSFGYSGTIAHVVLQRCACENGAQGSRLSTTHSRRWPSSSQSRGACRHNRHLPCAVGMTGLLHRMTLVTWWSAIARVGSQRDPGVGSQRDRVRVVACRRTTNQVGPSWERFVEGTGCREVSTT